MKLRRTRRIKGGHLWWNNPFKSPKNNAKDCKRWNTKSKEQTGKEECNVSQLQKYYYPGRTNRGRIPTLFKNPKKIEMTEEDWCEAVPYIGDNKLRYLNTRLGKKKFHPTTSCKSPPPPPLPPPQNPSSYTSLADARDKPPPKKLSSYASFKDYNAQDEPLADLENVERLLDDESETVPSVLLHRTYGR